jgi:primosomal protein N' (replication factor Y) (superfamily II helicase)
VAIARVEPLTNARALRGPFDYRLPAELAGVDVGSVLVVPFGRRRILGVVVALAEASEIAPERLAEPLAALEAGAPAELVRLGLWIGREYCSTPARGLGLVLPPGTGAGARRVRAARDRWARLTDAGREALASGERLGGRQRQALDRLADGDGVPARSLAEEGVGADVLRRLERRGLVAVAEVERRRAPASAAIGGRPGVVRLNAAQLAAGERVAAALERGEAAELLLHGVTGSGKTEVYLAAAAAALERGRSAIVLVPEIGLAPQTVHRFRARLGETVAVLHSGLAAGERFDEWRRLASGEARVCVGPRSAAFAPVGDLGLVVVDEEHDASYKQDGDPRYDAREVARHRAAEAGAVLLAGSATPRPESWVRLERLELPARAAGGRMPPVEVLDMRGRPGEEGPLHERAAAALAALEDEGGKAIVLVNRRGFAPHLACRSCGRAWRCPSCDVSLVLHRVADSLLCHHCGHREEPPTACPDCGSVAVARVGSGSERVAEAVAAAAGPVPVIRLDSDSAARRGAHLETLRRFDRADSAVLVGTQMVAKGHDFPEVVLGIVVNADAMLRFPDFRAEERTFSLLAQLAGRSGRGERGGRVLVQTLAPTARAIAEAARHDTAGFLAGELERRRALRYPPFASLARIELAAADEARTDAAAAEIHRALAAALPAPIELLGPATSWRRRGRHRRRLLLKGSSRAELGEPIRAALESATKGRRLREVAVSVDLDPQ